jgi:hypothetical protein
MGEKGSGFGKLRARHRCIPHYAALPDDWYIGVSDVVDSIGAIEAVRYRAVNLAGAASISAVANALGGELPLFVFGGDGARFA